jgi:DNA-binding MarR family transcriptional regulator
LPTATIRKRVRGSARRRTHGESVGQRPALDTAELEGALGFRLREAWGAMERYFCECFREEDITPATYAVLVIIAANPGCLAAEISSVTSISSANIIPYIDDLVERGLIRREVGATDRRVKHLHLTDKGVARLEVWRRLEKQVMRHFQAKVGADRLPRLLEWLGLITRDD